MARHELADNIPQDSEQFAPNAEGKDRKRVRDRNAQRAHRNRQRSHIKALEATIELLKDRSDSEQINLLMTENENLRREVKKLRSLLSTVATLASRYDASESDDKLPSVQEIINSDQSQNERSPPDMRETEDSQLARGTATQGATFTTDGDCFDEFWPLAIHGCDTSTALAMASNTGLRTKALHSTQTMAQGPAASVASDSRASSSGVQNSSRHPNCTYEGLSYSTINVGDGHPDPSRESIPTISPETTRSDLGALSKGSINHVPISAPALHPRSHVRNIASKYLSFISVPPRSAQPNTQSPL